tara:strand:- start:3024 stop:3482 length:459 start_codon:yes stop_codon:yes gene_type:complete
MDIKQNEIIKRLELGEPLSKICRDKTMPSLSAVYKAQREDEDLQKKIRNARETGVYTLLDKIAEDMEVPKNNQEMMFIKEKWGHIRWIASKLASNVFADKTKSEIKQDLTMSVSWGAPNDEKNMLQAKEVMDQVSSTSVKELPGNVGDYPKA